MIISQTQTGEEKENTLLRSTLKIRFQLFSIIHFKQVGLVQHQRITQLHTLGLVLLLKSLPYHTVQETIITNTCSCL
ncbi:hypothetical protein HA466_0018010 [Hirschfeldia incana]|nr:hypothetical protein HA466_0018010 [Hirschfeldia incana]